MSTPGAANTEAASIKPHTGKLGIMIPGMGAVATTLIAGVEAIRRGMAKPIGSLSQMGTIRLGKRTEGNSPLINDFLDIAPLEDLVFTGWDIFGGNLYDAAKTAQVLDRDTLEAIRPFLESIEPMPAVFDQHYVKRLTAKHKKIGKNKCDLANQIRNDIAEFKTKTDRQVMIWCGSTEIYLERGPVHETLEAFEKGLVDDESRHYAFDDVRMGGVEGGHSVRERRAQPDGRYSGAERAFEEDECADLRQGFQDRADLHQDGTGACVQDAHVGRVGLVLN